MFCGGKIQAVNNIELGENTRAVFHLLLIIKLAMKYDILHERKIRPLNFVNRPKRILI